MKNCSWPGNNEVMQKYHDEEWCVPSYDDRYIFEMLILEGAQAGLSWSIVLAKRDQYIQAFHNFDVYKCANLTDDDLENIRVEYNVIKNKNKIKSVRTNAQIFIEIQKEYGSFSKYIWSYVNNKQIDNKLKSEKDMQAKNEISEKISRDLMKKGFKFVGPVIIYSFMQAIGMINDHIVTCEFHNRK